VDPGLESARCDCAHCGTPLVGARARADGRAHADRRAQDLYCCAGCRVASALSGSALEGGADRPLGRLMLAGALAMGVMVFSLSLYGERLWGVASDGLAAEQESAVRGLLRAAALLLSLPVVLLVGVPIADAVVRSRRWLSADGLILVGVTAALALSVWNTLRGSGDVYFDTATAVLVLVAAGRWLEARARTRARERLSALLPHSEPLALRLDASGFDEVEVDAALLQPGDLVRVRPGAVVPVDGLVVEGCAFVDTAVLTGEQQPSAARPGVRVLAGSIALDGALLVRAESTGVARLRARFARLLDEGLRGRSRLVRLADRVATWLLPVVVALGGGTFAWRAPQVGAEQGLMDALSVVLIACPCALGLATPLVMTFALSEAWRRGVLVRGAEPLERIARARRIAFDKTGTLTSGAFVLERVQVLDGGTPAHALSLAAALERSSEHPVARALVRAAAGGPADRVPHAPPLEVVDFEVLPGRGVRGSIHGSDYELVTDPESVGASTTVVLRRADVSLARFELRGELRPEARAVVRELQALGLAARVLTGDALGPAQELAAATGLSVEHALTPEQKLMRVRELSAESDLIYVGDGLNDSGALAAAGVGISMSQGVARSLEAAHVHLVRPGLAELPDLVRLARRALSAARLNLAWAFVYNGCGLWFAATGRLSPVFAASAMVSSSLFVAWNASRVGRPEAHRDAQPAVGREPRPVVPAGVTPRSSSA
jgi:heavy metal translocating P-type ATPase